MMDLHRGAYTGQFGFFMIDSSNDPGLYDQEVFLALREWEPYLRRIIFDPPFAISGEGWVFSFPRPILSTS
jgi:hypothetical protein